VADEHIVTVTHNLDEYAAVLASINSAWDEHNEKIKAAIAELKTFQTMTNNLDESVRKTRSRSGTYSENIMDSVDGKRGQSGLKPPGWTSTRKTKQEPEMELFPFQPKVRRNEETGRFEKAPQRGFGWSGPKDTGPTRDYKAEWQKPSKEPLDSLNHLPWGAPKDFGSIGQFQSQPISQSERKLNTEFQRKSILSFPEFLKHFKDMHSLVSILQPGGGFGGLGILGRLLGMGGPAGIAAEGMVGFAAAAAERSTAFRERQQEAQALGTQPYQKAAFTNFMTKYAGASGATTALSEVIRQTTRQGGAGFLSGFLGEQGVRATGTEDKQTLAEDMMRAYQNMAQNVPEELWGRIAQKYGITPDINTIETMKTRGTTREQLEADIRKEQAAGEGLYTDDAKVMEDAADRFNQAVNRFSLAIDKVIAKTLGAVIEPHKTPEGGFEYLNPGKSLVPENWLNNLFGNKEEANPADLPAVGAEPKSMQLQGNDGNFVLPGTDTKVKDLSDNANDSSKSLNKFSIESESASSSMESLTKSAQSLKDWLGAQMFTIPGGGGGVGGGGGGTFTTGVGSEGTSVPIYHSGGIGTAGESTAPARMRGEGTSGRKSGGGGGGGGSDDSGKAYGKAASGSVAAAIFAGESKGDYDIYNYSGGRGVGHMKFEDMTVAQVMQAQKEGKIFAAGAYQIIPKTMQGAVSSLKIDPNTKFDKETQDKIFSGYLATAKKGRGPLEDYIKGKSDNSDAALKAAAQEWASIQYHGHGIYDKDGINHGGITDARMLAAMKNARDIYAKTGNYQGALFGQTGNTIASAEGGGATSVSGKPIYMGDSRSIGMSTAGPKGDVTGVVGQNPKQVLDQINRYKGDLANRDIYLSPGTANMMKGGSWDQAAFAKSGITDIDSQLAALKAKGADMSHVHILGVPGAYGGDYANKAMQSEAEKYGAQFKTLKSQELHPSASGYKEMFDVDKAAGKPKSKTSDVAYPPPNIDSSKKTSMNDMSNFQNISKGNDIQIFNKSGANVVMQTAQLGMADGSFNT
jgi:hypothetical protein